MLPLPHIMVDTYGHFKNLLRIVTSPGIAKMAGNNITSLSLQTILSEYIYIFFLNNHYICIRLT